MANIITGMRIVCSIALLFCPVLSGCFYTLYVAAGVTDMIDGTVARKTNTVSEFGSKLDTVADFIFVMVCLFKLIPIFKLSPWIYAWIGMIALIKLINVVFGVAKQKKLVAVHSIMNKVTGFLLFLLPLCLSWIDLNYSAVVLCAVATIAALQEGFEIWHKSGI